MLVTQTDTYLRNIIAVGAGLLLYSYTCYKVLKIVFEAWHGVVRSWCSENLPNLNAG